MKFWKMSKARYAILRIALVSFCSSVLFGCSDTHVAPSNLANLPVRKGDSSKSNSRLVGIDAEPATALSQSETASRVSRFGRPQFKDIAASAGIRFQTFNDEVPGRYFLPEVMGAGIAWIDFDGDGWLDLFLANGCSIEGPVDQTHHCQLFRNNQGRSFVDVTSASDAAISLFGQGCAVGDFDVDGFADLYVSGFGPDKLLKNNGDGTFQDVTQFAGVSDPRWGSSSLWTDLDGDLLLDLFVTNYVDASLQTHRICTYAQGHGYCGPGSFEAVEDCAYRNRGDGSFEEVATQWGLNAANGKGLAAIAVDFDFDLVPELYVANDMTANFLFARQTDSNDSQPFYKEIAQESGCAVSGAGMNEASMGVAVADFNLDGRPDIFLTHYYHAKNTLYKNLGKRVFEDDSYSSKAAATSTESLGFGVVVMDYNRDGNADLFIATGHVLGPEQQPQKMTPQLLQNERGIFKDVSASAGDYFRSEWIGRSAAAADFDNDGDIDVAVSQVGSPFVLLRNDTVVPDRPYIGLRLMTPNRIPPIGGRVTVRVSDREYVYPISAGGSYLAAKDERLLLTGWDASEGSPIVEVTWPSGKVDRFDGLAIDRYWQIFEGNKVPMKP